MTAVVAWTRNLSDRCEELIFASDSRLNGGRNIDCCPKIIPLPRSDCAICFAGDTDFAYPMMLQFSLAIDSFRPSRTRGMDFCELRSHALKVFNEMLSTVTSPIEELLMPDVSFLLGGYSWANKRFELWKIIYQNSQREFVFENSKRLMMFNKIAFGGDRGGDLKRRLIHKLRSDANYEESVDNSRKKNMEPFEVLRDLLRESNDSPTIGGAPQLIKVYQHMNVLPVPIFWPDRNSKRITLLGRPFLEYEHPDNWILDPDTCELYDSKEKTS